MTPVAPFHFCDYLSLEIHFTALPGGTYFQAQKANKPKNGFRINFNSNAN